MSERRAQKVKLVLLGQSCVGKSSLVDRFVKEKFDEHIATFGTSFVAQTVQLDDATVKFEIWDTAGQERYRSLAPMYYRGAQAAAVVYDICSYDSFKVANSWVEELQTGEAQTDPNIVIVLCGNKSDLASKRAVDVEEAQAYAEDNGLLFMETSAKSGANVDEVFIAVGRRLAKREATPETTGLVKVHDDQSNSMPTQGVCC